MSVFISDKDTAKLNNVCPMGHFRVFENPHFQNEAKCTTFLVKMSFICQRMKNYFHINGRALNLVLIQRPWGTQKWPIFQTKVTLNLNISVNLNFSARVSWSLLVQEWIPKAVELERIPTHKKCKCKEFCSQMRLGGEIYSFDVITY